MPNAFLFVFLKALERKKQNITDLVGQGGVDLNRQPRQNPELKLAVML